MSEERDEPVLVFLPRDINLRLAGGVPLTGSAGQVLAVPEREAKDLLSPSIGGCIRAVPLPAASARFGRAVKELNALAKTKEIDSAKFNEDLVVVLTGRTVKKLRERKVNDESSHG
jgi:hypothetical protein